MNALPTGFSVQLSPIPETLPIKSQLQLGVQTTAPEGYTAELSFIPLAIGEPGFTLSGQADSTLTFEPLRTGIQPLGRIQVDFCKDGQKEHSYLTDVLACTVTCEKEALYAPPFTLLPQEATSDVQISESLRQALISQVQASTTRPIPESRLSYVSGLVGGALLLAMCGWFFIKWLKKPARGLSPKEKAQRLLANLAKKLPHDEEEARRYMIELTQIVRVYLEGAYGIWAPKLTTEEFFRELQRKKPFDMAMQDAINAILQQADLVKFAKLKASGAECKTSLETAQKLISLDTRQA